MPGLESMRRRLSSIAKHSPEPTTCPSHTHPDTRLLDPDFFHIDPEDLTWFHNVNLAVRQEMTKLTIPNDYMHIQRVAVSAWNLYESEASQPWARGIDTRTIIVAALVSSLGALKYMEERAENQKHGQKKIDSPDEMQHIENDLLFGFLRHLDCPPDVAGPAALIASLLSFSREMSNKENVREHCEAYPALRFVQDAVRLDDLGCMGIARLGAQNKGTVLEMVYRMDAKLVHYIGLMKTKAGRREAESRWAQMQEFRHGLLSQADYSMGLNTDDDDYFV